VRTDGPPSRLVSGEPAEALDELTVAERWRGFAGDLPLARAAPVTIGEMPGQAVVDDPRADDQQVVAGRHAIADVVDEPPQVLETAGLAGVLRAAAAMTDGGIVADMADGPMVGGHLRCDPLDLGLTVPPADEDREVSIDPDQGAGTLVDPLDPVHEMLGAHDCAQTGSASSSAARSA
jgi:hypothetical protein